LASIPIQIWELGKGSIGNLNFIPVAKIQNYTILSLPGETIKMYTLKLMYISGDSRIIFTLKRTTTDTDCNL